MQLNLAWWNCSLSPPSTRAKRSVTTIGHLSVIELMLAKGTDILCLCEVDDQVCQELADYLELLATKDQFFKGFIVVPLYKKSGNSIDDFCLIYNSRKMNLVGNGSSLNSYEDVTQRFLKVGRKLELRLKGGKSLCLIMCHWQSRNTYAEGAAVRDAMARALRSSINEELDDDSNALVAICGDFNDEPFSAPIQDHLMASRDPEYVKKRSKALFNPFWSFLGVPDLVGRSRDPVGTCSAKGGGYVTNWKTFDQIILSSGFLGDGWHFEGKGAEIVFSLTLNGEKVDIRELSDHYPIACSLKRGNI
ncbi:endonuclease/exonuclease/phosphatase family protein [Pseudomonas oryzihabitans]|uniref:endonuclease/exonuclease/phosphatase family protein n=1 Tax=Pseudomonas oryzihabitans TaxID=47885 RepID=UPI000B09574B|nr:endonuclease/exonuclease/phosphatase family protein [Pseudomonas psychrotolerans]